MIRRGRALEIDIPEWEDIEWLQKQIRSLADKLEDLSGSIDETGYRLHDETLDLVDALREYTGA
ncbi:hypothetical protein HWB02_gp115 [Klebsiella phage KNP2]|uniref:hypothetical protein n=1 Tax=Klebsiella phage KNP2 TaxID=1871716 RepID=UPI0018AD3BDB|nr:hypothetical protein HWB02_gp115 [Klebsiella phage KNP2]